MMQKRSLLVQLSVCSSALLCAAAVGCGEQSKQAEKETVSVRRDAPPINPGTKPPGGATASQPAQAQGVHPEKLLENCLKEEQLKEGWINLFDGQTRMGWFSIGAANWDTAQGVISVDSGEPSFLSTSFQIADYELLVDFKCGAQTNSGIFLRTTANPQDVGSECYELNIAPTDNPFPTGSLVKRKRVDPEAIGEVAPDTWHTYRVIAERDTIKVWLDDKQVMDYTDPNPLGRGYISLQHNSGRIEFRNILMRPLGTKPLPVGQDWETAWRQEDKPDAKFTVTGSEEGLRLKGGAGAVESKEQWDDFVLQATYQLPNPDVNSGIFFRCVPESTLDGYECQLNHSTQNNNPIMPTDYGAGGIFKRQAARLVVGQGTDPTYVTIIAEHLQIATWINGLQVVDYVDDRAADPNPRKGARRQAGPIALQGHDETTEILFSQISVAPIAPAQLSTQPPSETSASNAP